jgi:hypothetical protein
VMGREWWMGGSVEREREKRRRSSARLVEEESDVRLTTQVMRLVELKLKSKKAPKQVETLLVVPKGPRLKSSEVML